MRKFFIEISYWAAYFMKWKSEKEIQFDMGVFYSVVLFWINITTLFSLIQIYTGLLIYDSYIGLFPDDFFKKENKYTSILFLLPFGFMITYLVVNYIYQKSNKKTILKHFKSMSLKRQTIGKLLFISYSVSTVVIAFWSGTIMYNQHDKVSNENVIREQRIERFRNYIEQSDSLSRNETRL